MAIEKVQGNSTWAEEQKQRTATMKYEEYELKKKLSSYEVHSMAGQEKSFSIAVRADLVLIRSCESKI